MVYDRYKQKDEIEPYDEPNPDADRWPEDWTPKQRQNWIDVGSKTYDNLETDRARYWYRRTWRPKARHDGMMKREHVKLGTPEDYIVENVADYLNPMGDMTSWMMRKLTRYSVDTDELDDVVEEIVHAKIQNMSDDRKHRLIRDTQRVANLYGVE